ncbi:MAG: TetR/AcrR family transcriptional regulator [Verrucomicrobia bacterium]|nr:TetR/AcrR family transcriptional regulator [Verrucomicrobiota bacterium]
MRKPNDTRLKLLQTALDLFWEKSYGSVSVDDICACCGVNKGSFYYAFKSKSELSIAALEHYWAHSCRPSFDAIFSDQVPPLERLQTYCQTIANSQLAKYQKTGKICGCPFSSIGCELSTQDDPVREKIQEIAARTIKYIAGAVRDAIEENLIKPRVSAGEIAKQVYCYVVGCVMQSRIENNSDSLTNLKAGVFRILDTA